MIKNVHGGTVDLLGEAIVTGRYPVGSSLPPEPIVIEPRPMDRDQQISACHAVIAGLARTDGK